MRGPYSTPIHNQILSNPLYAGEVETVVTDRLRMLMTTPSEFVGIFAPTDASPDALERLTEAAATRAGEMASPNGGTRRAAVLATLDRVIVHRDGIRLHLRPDAFGEADKSDDPIDKDQPSLAGRTPPADDRSSDQFDRPDRFELHIAVRLVLARGRSALVIEGEPVAARTGPDRALVKAIARAVTWGRQLVSGQFASVAEIARAEQVTDRYVHRLLPLAFLDPDIVTGIVEGRITPAFTVTDLMNGVNLPSDWSEQRQVVVARRSSTSD